MNTRTLALVAAGLILAASAATAAPDDPAGERVKGASLISPDAQLESVFPQMLGLTFDQQEIDLFLTATPEIGAWINDPEQPENKKAWNGVDGSDNPLKKILGLKVWEDEAIGVTGAEFFTLVIKLKMAQEILRGNIQVDQLKQQKQFLESMLSDPNLPEESKTEMQKNVDMMDSMINAVENYPESNRTAFKENKEKLDAALEELEGWGDDSASEPEDEEVPLPPVEPRDDEPGDEEPGDAPEPEAPKPPVEPEKAPEKTPEPVEPK